MSIIRSFSLFAWVLEPHSMQKVRDGSNPSKI